MDISVNVMFETPSAVNKPNDSAHIQRAREKTIASELSTKEQIQAALIEEPAYTS